MVLRRRASRARAPLKITPLCGNYYCYKALLLLSCGYSHKANDRMVYFVNFLNKVDKYSSADIMLMLTWYRFR